MKITSDWHIHTVHSYDAACITIEGLIEDVKKTGIKRFGISDHLNNCLHIKNIENSRAAYELSKNDSFFFGIEAACVAEKELMKIEKCKYPGDIKGGLNELYKKKDRLAIPVNEELVRKWKCDYVIGGVHKPTYTEPDESNINNLIEDYHRQNLFLAEHDLIDIVAHTWWRKNKNGFYAWNNDFGIIPYSLHDELACALKENNTKLEVPSVMLSSHYSNEKFTNQYAEYLSYMAESGVMLAFGSDCHKEHYYNNSYFEKYEKILTGAGIKDEHFWTL